MDLRKQLHGVLWVRVPFLLALLVAVLWVQIDDHGFVPLELGLGVAAFLLACVPFFLIEDRVPPRTLAAVLVALDLGLVTLAVIFAGGALSAVPLFYVWSIVLASVFLPSWAPFAAAAAAGGAYAAIWRLQDAGVLKPPSLVAQVAVPPNWMLIVFLAFLLIALLSGRLANALMRSTTLLSGAKAQTEAQLARVEAANQQLRIMSESSRVFLRHHDVESLMPEALEQMAGASGVRAGFALVRNENTNELDQRATMGPVDDALVRKMRDVGIGNAANGGTRVCVAVDDPLTGRLLQTVEKHGFHGFVIAPLAGKETTLGLICLLFGKDEVVSDAAVGTLQALSDQVALVVRNIQYNEELTRKNDELTHLDQLKSDFMATMSHELRTPLTSIIGYSDMLLSGMTGELNEKQGAFIDSILKSGESLLNLINDVLDLTKIEAGRLDLNREPVDLRAALLGVLPVIKPRAQEKRIRISTFLPTELPPVWADPGKFNQILLNLLTNGIKYTPENGNVSVEARSSGDAVEIWVNDTGIGIAPEDQDKIFLRFTQIDSSATRSQGGTGLGLAITRELVELHGGRIRVQSKVGRGSSFVFTMPISPRTAGPMPAEAIL